MSIDAARVTEHPALSTQHSAAGITIYLSYHAQRLTTCLDILKSTMNGLSDEEAQQRFTAIHKKTSGHDAHHASQSFLGNIQTAAFIVIPLLAS